MSRRNSPAGEGGFTLVVILVAVCIIAVLVWLRPFSSSDESRPNTPAGTVKQYKKAQDDLGGIQERLEERNAEMVATGTED